MIDARRYPRHEDTCLRCWACGRYAPGGVCTWPHSLAQVYVNAFDMDLPNVEFVKGDKQ